MKKSYDVVALGELLIDFTESGSSSQGNQMLEANPGGAPCNVLAMLKRLGRKTAFIGKVGNDMFGKQLEQALEEVGIDTIGLVKDEKIHTTLAFVHTFEDGDRDFSFYRNPGADMMLSEKEVKLELLEDCKCFHFGSLSMTDEPCRTATRKAIEIAKNAGAFITFDPNLREPLWDSMELAKEQIAYGMSVCNMLKISDNEITWFTGLEDYDEAIAFLQREYPNIELILLSLGKEGSMAVTQNKKAFVPAFIQSATIETTGAGDTFCGSVISFVLKYLENGSKPEEWSGEMLATMLKFANAAASIITTKKGALRVMPHKEEVEEFLCESAHK